MFVRRAVALAAVTSALAAPLLAVAPTPVAAKSKPDVIALPTGLQPEGITTGNGHTFYVGSIPTGAVIRGDLRTGETAPLVPAHDGRAAIGMKYDHDLLYVAGGPTGKAFVYDAKKGSDVAVLTLTSGSTFVNDVTVTKDAAYFTDSVNPVLYRVALGKHGTPGSVTTLPLTGDLVYVAGFNVNGIAATPDGKRLVVVQTNTGRLFVVDPKTGHTTGIDLGGDSVPNGDGILLDGQTLYVVQNQLNLIARVDLTSDLRRGTVVSRTGHPAFDVPTTIAEDGKNLYAVNARFGIDEPENASYSVVRLGKP
jgi:sugar lactone lactonase YvrE